ncbi:hypothetical protein H375_1020 [Rickettsia prowazekii str. Breinl]|nr:hypothetical protein H375_1020 [Rickettsia prowazekii str. Breinl]
MNVATSIDSLGNRILFDNSNVIKELVGYLNQKSDKIEEL